MPNSTLTNAKNIRKKAARPLEDIHFAFKAAGNDKLQAEMNELLVGVVNLQRDASEQIDIQQLQQELVFLDRIAERKKAFNADLQTKNEKKITIERKTMFHQARLDSIQNNIASIEEQKRQSKDKRVITKLSGQLIEKEDEAAGLSSNIKELNASHSALLKSIKDVEDEQNQFLKVQADKITLCERSSTQLKASIQLVDTIYKEAMQKDKQMAQLIRRLGVLLGVTAGLAALAVLAYFVPFVVAGTFGVFVGALPACIIFVVGILFVAASATKGPSSSSAFGSRGSDFELLFKGLVKASAWLGMKTYAGSMIIMPYIAISAAIAAVGTLIAAFATGIQLAVVKKQKNAFFDKKFSDGLKDNSLFKVSNPPLPKLSENAKNDIRNARF